MWRVSGGQLWTGHWGSVGRPSPAASPYSCVSRVSKHLTGVLSPFLLPPTTCLAGAFLLFAQSSLFTTGNGSTKTPLHLWRGENACVCVCVSIHVCSYLPTCLPTIGLRQKIQQEVVSFLWDPHGSWTQLLTQIFDVFILLAKQNDLDIHKSARMISVLFYNDLWIWGLQQNSLRMGHCFGGVSSTLQTYSWQLMTVLSSVLGFSGQQKPLASHGAPVWRQRYRWCLSKKKLGFGRHQKHNAW